MAAPPFRSGPAQRPQPQPTRVSDGSTTGPTSAVPCPWCGHKQDFRGQVGADMGGMGEGAIGVETGAVWSCEKCNRRFKILAVQQVTVIKVARFNPAPRR